MVTEVEFISSERLEKYRDLTSNVETAIILHNQTLRLGTSLMSMIAMIEYHYETPPTRPAYAVSITKIGSPMLVGKIYC